MIKTFKLIGVSIAIIFFIITWSCSTTKTKSKNNLTKEEEKKLTSIEEKIYSGETQSAIDQFYEIKDDSSENLVAYAGLLISNGKYNEAEKELCSLIEKEPDNSNAIFYLALIKGINNEPKKEIELLEKVIKINPMHSDALSVRASFYLSDSKLEKAAELYKKALDVDSENVQSLTGLGTSLLRQDKLQEAEPYLNKAVELDSLNPYTYLDRSKVRRSLGNYKGAEEDLTKAITLQPEYFWHYLDRGRLRFRKLKDYSGAVEDLSKALQLDPENFYPYIFRAASYDELGDIKSAAADYRSIIKMKPNYDEAYSALAIDSFILKNWDESIRSFEKAFVYESDEYAYLAMAALAEYHKGTKKESKKYLENIMRKIPSKNIFNQVVRACLDDSYSKYTVNLIRQEKNANFKKRLLFYVAELYKEKGEKSIAINYLKEAASLDKFGYFEGRIAKYELENIYE